MSIPNIIYCFGKKISFTNTDVCHWTPWIGDSPLFGPDENPLVLGSKAEARDKAVDIVTTAAFDEGMEVNA
jgi:hypothetical protein